MSGKKFERKTYTFLSLRIEVVFEGKISAFLLAICLRLEAEMYALLFQSAE